MGRPKYQHCCILGINICVYVSVCVRVCVYIGQICNQRDNKRTVNAISEYKNGGR